MARPTAFFQTREGRGQETFLTAIRVGLVSLEPLEETPLGMYTPNIYHSGDDRSLKAFDELANGPGTIMLFRTIGVVPGL